MDNVELFVQTKKIIKSGGYANEGGANIRFAHALRDHAFAHVVPAETAGRLVERHRSWTCGCLERLGSCTFEVVEQDSYAYAQNVCKRYDLVGGMFEKSVLVLNFANPVNPGGGVLIGARAQEEDLCRRSTLYASLTSEEARSYYERNRKLSDFIYSDDMVISPVVEVFRDGKNALLDEPFTVAVLSAAAPVANRLPDLSKGQMEAVLYRRISIMFQAAWALGYKHLTLGAWGCGAFGNDPLTVSKAFFDALRDFERDLCKAEGTDAFSGRAFKHVGFAILDRTDDRKNIQSFARVFGTYYELWDKRIYGATFEKALAPVRDETPSCGEA